MKKFSVICPTMWRCEEFVNFLSSILDNEYVEELILVNNDYEKTPPLPEHKKLIILNFKENIGVNKAWNVGAFAAKSDLLAIINDDIQFDLRILSILNNLITEEYGMIGLNLGSQKGDVFIKRTDYRYFGYACAFFIHRNNYTMIPKELKIYFGDDWLFETNKRNGKFNMIIEGLECKHSLDKLGGNTSRFFLNSLNPERLHYNNLIKQYVI